jgi:16S rRNA U516 pseudouridylate synthase RsuA-like enzyme
MPPRKKKVKQMLYLYEEQVRDLKRMAAHMDEPMSKLIRHAVDDFLKKHKRKKVAEKT